MDNLLYMNFMLSGCSMLKKLNIFLFYMNTKTEMWFVFDRCQKKIKDKIKNIFNIKQEAFYEIFEYINNKYI